MEGKKDRENKVHADSYDNLVLSSQKEANYLICSDLAKYGSRLISGGAMALFEALSLF